MLERLVENWLTETSERRSLDVVFPQLLTHEGYTVIHVARHSEQEQGKDVIAIHPSGDVHAFQLKALKGKRLTLNGYRSFESEIQELVELRIEHPLVPQEKIHKPFLVITGEVDDQVATNIRNSNLGRWADRSRFRPLETIGFSQLHARIINAFRDGEPTVPGCQRDVLIAALTTGKGMIDKDMHSRVIEGLLKFDSKPLSSSSAKSLVASVCLVYGVVLSAYVDRRNHWAVVEGLVILWSAILAYAERHGIPASTFSSALDTTESAIFRELDCLISEACSRSHWEWKGPGEEVLQIRCTKTLVVGAIASRGLQRLMSGIPERVTDCEREWVERNRESIFLCGEGVIPAILALHWWGCKFTGDCWYQLLLGMILKGLVTLNGHHVIGTEAEKSSLPSPYYGVEDCLLRGFALEPDPGRKETFGGTSFTLETLYTLFAPLLWRGHLRALWPEIAEMQLLEFRTDQNWELLRWKAESGEIVTYSPEEEQSYHDLIRRSREFDSKRIPSGLLSRMYMVPLWLMVFPQRLTRNIACALAIHIEQA